MYIIILESWDKMEKSELKRELTKINDEVKDLWRSLWHWSEKGRNKRKDGCWNWKEDWKSWGDKAGKRDKGNREKGKRGNCESWRKERYN